MAQKRHLTNAPIKEAIIDIQVRFEEQIQITELQSKLVEIEDDYPDVETIERRGLLIEQSDEYISPKSINEGPFILKYTNTDKTYIAQFKKEGFTLSRLEPYTNWEEFKNEAFRLWNIYKEKTNPIRINRIAVRYVNVMEFKTDASQLEKYLTYTSSFPIRKSKIESFLNRYVFYDYEYDSNVILTQALNTMDGGVNLILDIDAFSSKGFEVNDDIYLNHYEKLHDLKNLIFFESITEETAEIYS